MRKKLRFIYSMQFAIILLIMLGVISIIGTLIPQEMPLHWYEHRFSPRVFTLIRLFNLNDMYHTWWFTGIFALLVLNLLLCSVIRLPKIYKKSAKPYILGEKKFYTPLQLNEILSKISKLGFNNPKNKGNLIYFSRGKIGYFGSWLTHMGFLIIVICYFLGRIYGFNTQISGLPSETIEVSGTDFKVHIEDFLIDYRDDFSINQYYSYIDVSDDNNKKSMIVSVNNPAKFNDYSIYQIATGWAVMLDVEHPEQSFKRPMYERDFHFLDDNAIIRVIDILPDVISNGPLPENPKVIYQFIYNNRIESMNYVDPNQTLRWRGYDITFGIPQRYTVLEISKDPMLGGVLFGSIFLMLGLVLSFYVNPTTIVIKPLNQEGYVIHIHSQKQDLELQEKIQEIIKEGEKFNDRKAIV